MESFTFYKDNRIDGAFQISEADLRSRFLKWLASHKDKDLMLKEYPYMRIIHEFLLVAGSFENSQFEELVSSLKDAIRNYIK